MPKIINPSNSTIPTTESIRHTYGEAKDYVRSLAARMTRALERAGKKGKTKQVNEDLKLILDDLDQALNEDVTRIKAGEQPFTHNYIKDILDKRYSSFADLVDEYFDDEDDESDDEDSSESAKAKKFYLVEGSNSVIPADDSAFPMLLAAISDGKGVQLITINEGVPSFATIAESKKKKSADDTEEPGDDSGNDLDASEKGDSGNGAVKRGKISITHNGVTLKVPCLTVTTVSGKSKKSVTYVLATSDGAKAFKSIAQANVSDNDVVWYEVAKKPAGMTANGNRRYEYTLASNPDTIPYDHEDDD